jgi:hypothetical protein
MLKLDRCEILMSRCLEVLMRREWYLNSVQQSASCLIRIFVSDLSIHQMGHHFGATEAK